MPPRRTSSPCVPASTMQPLSMTRMRSAFWTVASRCAITSVVRSVHQTVKRLLHSALAFGIERTRRFVEQQDRRVLQNGARNRNPLTLAARQRRTALAELAVVAVGQRPNELIGLRGRRGAANL